MFHIFVVKFPFMKRKQLYPIALLFLLAFALILFYTPPTEYKKIVGYTQGTTYNITYEDRPGRNLKPRIEQLLLRFDLSLSTYDSTSIISKINRNEKNVKLDRFFRRVFNKSDEIYHLTGGAFDITIGPVVSAWGFGPGERSKTDSSYIDSLLQFVGMDKVSIAGGKVVKTHPNVRLNVNAIAQGYSVDIVAEFLERKSITNYLIEIGGELKTKGLNPDGKPWKVGIDKPVDNNFSPGENLQAIVQLNNKSLATSGNYRKFFEKEGVKYAHSINPHTGYPALNRLLSTTVVANDCMTADALATAFMVMGLEKSIFFLSKHLELEAYLVYSDEEGRFKTYITPGMKELILSEVQ